MVCTTTQFGGDVRLVIRFGKHGHLRFGRGYSAFSKIIERRSFLLTEYVSLVSEIQRQCKSPCGIRLGIDNLQEVGYVYHIMSEYYLHRSVV
jgi:hypothetical protein